VCGIRIAPVSRERRGRAGLPGSAPEEKRRHMGMRDSYLFPTLEAGSTRVFNVCHATQTLERAIKRGKKKQDATPLFHTRELNRAILVKEARPNPATSRYKVRKSVGTKLYLPYNIDNIYEGGKSVFIDDPLIEAILRDHAGLNLDTGGAEAEADYEILKLMEDIPSLDPFLVKDKLEIEGHKVNDHYFELASGEWDDIKKHVSEKLQPIINFAFPDADSAEDARASTLVNKLWSTKDFASLQPIIEAFGLPMEEAGSIFAAWKGILYYDYECTRSRDDWEACHAWLKLGAHPVDFVDRNRMELLTSMRQLVTQQFDEIWRELEAVFAAYYDAYEKLFVKRENAAPFVDFMRNAVQSYWVLGPRMSLINHSVTVWDILTGDHAGRRLKFEPLYTLLDIQHGILDERRKMK
jgi:hypothetical protein